MRLFWKNILPFLFLLLFFNNTFADTLLDSVELDSGYRNFNIHLDTKGIELGGGTFEVAGCFQNISLFVEIDAVEDSEGTWTYIGQGLYRFCGKGSGSSIETSYSDSCSTCTRSSSNSEGMRCSDQDQRLGTIFIQTGSVTINSYADYSDLLQLFGRCGYSPPSYQGYGTYKGDSSYTFRIECEGEKTASILHIEAKDVMLISENQISGRDFFMNGNRPFYIKETASFYSEYDRVYYWMGALYWDIPIYKRCGESVTVTSSLRSGYGDVRVNAVKAIFDCPIDVNVPPVVMPKKTGNNVADVAITLLTPAPSGGVDVKLTVEPVKNSGGHIEDGHTGTRLKGEITDDYGSKIDTIKFAEGETQKMVKYKADEVAGEEKIIAEIVDKEIKCEETVNVKVPELFGLGVGGSYRLTGSTGTHPVNHYGTASTIVRTNYIANDYLGETGTVLGINDMSLPWGGLFDVNENWSTPHSLHRTGKSVDIDRCADGVLVDQTLLDRIATRFYGATRIVERALRPPPCAGPADTPRIHYEFSGGGIRIIPVPPVGGGGDTGGGTVDGGTIPQ